MRNSEVRRKLSKNTLPRTGRIPARQERLVLSYYESLISIPIYDCKQFQSCQKRLIMNKEEIFGKEFFDSGIAKPGRFDCYTWSKSYPFREFLSVELSRLVKPNRVLMLAARRDILYMRLGTKSSKVAV